MRLTSGTVKSKATRLAGNRLWVRKQVQTCTCVTAIRTNFNLFRIGLKEDDSLCPNGFKGGTRFILFQ